MSTHQPSVWMKLSGTLLSIVSGLALFGSASMKLSHNANMVDMLAHKFGYPEALLTPLGILELSIALLYALPRTSVLGAVLATGYLGGAVATHVRVGDMFIAPLLLGVFLWLGLLLRRHSVRTLLLGLQ